MRRITTQLVNISFIAILLIGGFVLANNYMQHHGREEGFAHWAFTPAVLAACGHGYINSNVASPELKKFLSLGKQTFSCDALPKNIIPAKFTGLQATKYYLLAMTAGIWKLFGISWDKLFYISAILFALALVAGFLLFRLAMGLTISGFLTLVFGVTLLHTGYFPDLHDFCMAPFFLWYLLFLGKLVKYPFSFYRGFILAVLAGLVLGIGLGFTVNFLIYTPLFILTVFLFTPAGLTKRLGIKLGISGVYCAVLFCVAHPVLIRMAHGNNLFQNAIQGLSDSHVYELYIKQSPIYDMLTHYSDEFVRMILVSYANHVHHYTLSIPLDTKPYVHFGMTYLIEIIKYFPGDVITHGVASLLKILSLPFSHLLPARWLPTVGVIYAASLSIAALSLIVLRNYSLRIAIFVLLLILFLGFYPAIQYEGRHVFFLSIISLWMLGLIINLAIKIITQPNFRGSIRINLKGSLLIVLIPSVLIVSAMTIAVIWQQHQLHKLFTRYDNAQLQAVSFTTKLEKNNLTQINIPNVTSGNLVKQSVRFGYLMINLDQKQCKSSPVYLQVTYRKSPFCQTNPNVCSYDKLAHTLKISVKDNSKVFLPVYDNYIYRFSGIKVPTKQVNCITKIAKIKNLRRFPLQLFVMLPNNWHSQRLFQQIGRPQYYEVKLPKVIHTSPENLVIDQKIWQFKLHKPVLSFRSRLVKFNSGSLIVAGKPNSDFNFILQFVPKVFTKSELATADYYFVAEGKLQKGGFSIGLVKDRKWIQSSLLNLTTTGDFKIAIKIITPGMYKMTLANFLRNSGSNHFKLFRYGWLKIRKKSNV